MAITQFKLPIGAKRQVTIPKEFMELLSLEEGHDLLLQVEGGYATLKPMISVLREELPEELRKRFEARRGRKASDVPLAEFMGKLGRKPKKQTVRDAALVRLRENRLKPRI